MPLTTPVRQSSRVGRMSGDRRRENSSRIAPDTANRAPAMSRGGNVSTANRIARYVEPQMMYTAANAARRRPRIEQT